MERHALSGVVYGLIHPRFPGYTKIGKAVSGKRRLAQYDTGDPLRQYAFAFTIEVSDRHRAELRAHRILDGYRLPGPGEWFRIHHDEAFNLINGKLTED